MTSDPQAMPTRDVLVLDASALVELVIDGRHRAGADAVLDRLDAPHPPTLMTAAHGLLEVASALRRLCRGGLLSADQGRTLLRRLAGLDVVLAATSPQLDRVWDLRETMSAYDAAHAVTAEVAKASLITADGRLLRACTAAGVRATHLDELR